MVLSDRYGGTKRPSIVKRTVIYVVSFGLGSLLIAALLSVAFVSLAEGLLPSKQAAPKAGDAVLVDKPIVPKPKSKLLRPLTPGIKAQPPLDPDSEPESSGKRPL